MSKKFDQFFEAFQSCDETKAAVLNGKLSIDRKMLTKAAVIPRKEVPLPEPIPYPYDELLRIQGTDGRWQDKDDVFYILHIPDDNYFGSMEEWEVATTFAIAKIRQRYDLFHLLGDAHDRAMEWMPSTKYIRAATDIISTCAVTERSESPSASKSKGKIGKAPVDPYRETLARSSRFSYSRTISAMRSMSMEAANSAEQVEQMQRAADRARMAMQMLAPTLNFTALSERIAHIKQSTDSCEVSTVHLYSTTTSDLHVSVVGEGRSAGS